MLERVGALLLRVTYADYCLDEGVLREWGRDGKESQSEKEKTGRRKMGLKSIEVDARYVRIIARSDC